MILSNEFFYRKYILLNKTKLLNKNIFNSNENIFYRMKIFFIFSRQNKCLESLAKVLKDISAFGWLACLENVLKVCLDKTLPRSFH